MEKELLAWLESLNLTKQEAEILAFIMVKGQATVNEISEGLGIARPHVYTALKNLWAKGFIAKSSSRPAVYNALPSIDALRMRVKELSEWYERMLSVVESLASRVSLPERAVFIEGGNAFLTHLVNDVSKAKMLVWIALPRLSIAGKSLETALYSARSRGVDVRVAACDYGLLKRFPSSPNFYRYVEPPPPFVLAIVDSTSYFSPATVDFLPGGIVTRSPQIVREYKAYFEHIWSEDYLHTVHKIRVRSPREVY